MNLYMNLDMNLHYGRFWGIFDQKWFAQKKLDIGNFTIEIINKTHEVSKSFGKIKKFTNFGLISSKKNLFSDSFLF